MRSHLLILGERDAIAWVVSQQRMGFTADRASSAAAAISVGDELLLYATRGAFHNPTKDRGRVFGRAVATSGVEKLKKPVLLVGRAFTHGFAFDLGSLAPPRHGVDLADLIPQLSSFPNKTGWATSLRRPLFTLTREDARLLRQSLRAEERDLDESAAGYRAESRTPIRGR